MAGSAFSSVSPLRRPWLSGSAGNLSANGATAGSGSEITGETSVDPATNRIVSVSYRAPFFEASAEPVILAVVRIELSPTTVHR